MPILFNPVAVSDTDVVIKLCKASRLDVLTMLFFEIMIPGKVHEEILRKAPKCKLQLEKLEALKVMHLTDTSVFNKEKIDAM